MVYYVQPWYVGRHLEEIERRMVGIRPPSSFPRYPGKLDDIKKNKASDWENMLFHYFYPCFVGLLPKENMDNLMLLSSCIFTLLELHLDNEKIDKCEEMLKQFAQEFQNLFGEECMTFNVHLLTHLAQSTRNFGALWNSSLFPYESANGTILKYRTGNNHPVVQMTRKYIMNRFYHYTKIPDVPLIKEWHSRIWYPKKRQQLKYDERLVFTVSNSIETDGANTANLDFSYHDRCQWNYVQYRTHEFCKMLGYDDSYIFMNDQFLRIEHILTDKANNVYIVERELIIERIYQI